MVQRTRARRILVPLFILSLLSIYPASRAYAQVILTADGETPAYTLVRSALGASPETPDCSHPEFGPHITQDIDDDLQKYVFVFNIHVTPDNDRCSAFDRQRLEIKTDGGSPAYVKGFLNDTVTFRWKFKLPDGFQPSTSFTHIHQIKAFDGDAGAPIITITPRKASPNRLELIHVNSSGMSTRVATTPLEPFIGKWVEAYEKLTYSYNGQYSLVITDLATGDVLFSYSNDDIDLWRTGTTVVRPKWGIYRSLNNPGDLRDEQVRFDRFCLAKGDDDCVSDQLLPDFSMFVVPVCGSTPPGGSTSFMVYTSPIRDFDGDATVTVAGLPAGATSQVEHLPSDPGYAASLVTITTADDTPVDDYPLILNAISGILSHVAIEPLHVTPPE